MSKIINLTPEDGSPVYYTTPSIEKKISIKPIYDNDTIEESIDCLQKYIKLIEVNDNYQSDTEVKKVKKIINKLEKLGT